MPSVDFFVVVVMHLGYDANLRRGCGDTEVCLKHGLRSIKCLTEGVVRPVMIATWIGKYVIKPPETAFAGGFGLVHGDVCETE